MVETEETEARGSRAAVGAAVAADWGWQVKVGSRLPSWAPAFWVDEAPLPSRPQFHWASLVLRLKGADFSPRGGVKQANANGRLILEVSCVSVN